MPFLRRRGDMTSDTNIRRHTPLNPSQPPNKNDKELKLSLPPATPLMADQDVASLSRHYTTEPESSEPTSGKTTADSLKQTKSDRFSILRHRNASDPQLSLRAKQQAETTPPVPRPPAIITTAPTIELPGPKKAPSRLNLAAKFRRSSDLPRTRARPEHSPESFGKTERTNGSRDTGSSVTFGEPADQRPSIQAIAKSSSVSLSASHHRQSESSRSDASSAGHLSNPSPSTTPKKAPTTSPFFKFRRNRKAPEPLFPLAHLPQKQTKHAQDWPSTSLTAADTRPFSSRSAMNPRAATEGVGENSTPQGSAATALLVRGGAPHSGQSSPTRTNLLRGRSSTMSSVGRDSTDDHLLAPTARTSTSTGRKSFGDLLGLGRIRQNSELTRQGSMTPVTPGSIGSKSNSLQLPRDSVTLPERQDDESPAKYLARIEGIMSRGVIASALSKGTDPFSAAVLRSYMRSFSFFGDPMDMAIRKLLMEAELPRETQQIDRCLQAFANRYHECNPGIYSSPDQAYFIAFSLLILHTDVFNKNNKHKMQKSDYLKNTRGEGIFDDILECFYDNISYTPFIHVEDDLCLAPERTFTNKSKKKQLSAGNGADSAKRATKEPIDPYTLILDGNLEALRPNLKDAMSLDDHYNYLGTTLSFNLKELRNTFFKTGVLQIVSARSRPDAFMSERTATNPKDSHPGIVDIRVTKVGLLWRKDAKKRKARSPWQEWGAILTGAQLYFFKNTSWVKNLMHQHEHHLKSEHDGMPVIFKPPLEEFKPDALMSTHAAVALVDNAYKKHKNAFVYVRQGGLDEILLADNEEERNDWLAKLNYAAAFKTSGVRIRGVLGANYDGQGRRGIRRLDSSEATQLVQTPTGPVSIARGLIDRKMAEDIQAARRDGMQKKIREAETKVESCQKQLEEQLRNARHLQILAPIQPRTRDQLLLAAARLSAQLRWTRMDIWREKCHRDILLQDLADDEVHALDSDNHPDTNGATSTRKLSMTQLESGSKRTDQTEKGSYSTAGGSSPRVSIEADVNRSNESLMESSVETPGQNVVKSSPYSNTGSNSNLNSVGARRGSGSSVAISPTQPSSTPAGAPKEKVAQDTLGLDSSKASENQDDVDADEQDLLRQVGLWQTRSRRKSLNNAIAPLSNEVSDIGAATDREKLERNKIRRSLQRTLRESAGHLSHHRSKRGKDVGPPGPSDDPTKEAILSRGTGSFVVHGKKASVINLGSELQTLSQEERILSRKPHEHLLQEEYQPPVLPFKAHEHDDDFHSAHEEPPESIDSSSRRGSAASASTATARSFRELHRKYSSAQAARSLSGVRLAVPSDGESEAAVSISDGRRSFQIPAGKEKDVNIGKSSLNEDDSQLLNDRNGDIGQKGEDADSDDDENTQQERDTFSRRAVQAVTA